MPESFLSTVSPGSPDGHSAAHARPVIALATWTAVMWAWMYATRIPAIMRLCAYGNLPRGEQIAPPPPRVRWKADNYNHLLEQPIL